MLRVRPRGTFWFWKERELRLDRQGLALDGFRLPLDTRVSLDERFLVLDSRSRQDVLGHDIPDAALDEVRELLESTVRRAREIHGNGREDVPETLRLTREGGSTS